MLTKQRTKMREKWNVFKARLSMVWHALVARNCIVTWVEDEWSYSAFVVHNEEWPAHFDVNIDEE